MPQDSFTPALARLDPASRALLDLSLRRNMRPEEIGDILGTDPESVIVAREAALEQLASEMELGPDPDLDELRSRLTELPGEAWTGQPAAEPEAPEAAPEPASEAATPAPAAARPAEKPAARKERRSRLPLLLVLLAVVAIVLVVSLASGGDDGSKSSSAPAPAPPQSSKPSKPASKPAKPSKPAPKPAPSPQAAALTPVAGGSAKGQANLVGGGKSLHLEVTGLPSGSYEVWLYNSVIDAQSIGKASGTKINLDVKLPQNASRYRYIDVSREPADGNPNHSGESVMRVPLAKLAP